MPTFYTLYSRSVKRSNLQRSQAPLSWEFTTGSRWVFTGTYLECIARMASAVSFAQGQPGYQVHKDWRPGQVVLEPDEQTQQHLAPWVLYMEPGRPKQKEVEPGTVSAGNG